MSAMDEIRHLVVLMLENQSFDRLLGYLDLGDRTQKLEGLLGAETNPVSPPTDTTPVPVTRVSAPSAYVTVAGHDFEDVNQQLFADRAPSDTNAPRNTGFVLNYSQQTGSDGRRLSGRGRDIMQCLDPTLVPILTTLARNFTVCDTFDRNFLPSARSVPLTNLRGLVPAARTSTPAGRALSAYQRSLQALAEAMGNPPRSAPGVDESARHAQTFLQQPQSP